MTTKPHVLHPIETPADALCKVPLTAQQHYQYKSVVLEKTTIYGNQVQQNKASSSSPQ